MKNILPLLFFSKKIFPKIVLVSALILQTIHSRVEDLKAKNEVKFSSNSHLIFMSHANCFKDRVDAVVVNIMLFSL